MSNLTLNIKANDGDLTKLNTAIDRLEAVLKQPVSASVSGLTEQLTALDAKAAESSTTLAGLQKTVAAAAAETSVLAASVAEAGAGFEKVSADAGKAKGGIDLLTASMSDYALAMQGTKAEIATTTALLETQAKASAQVLRATRNLGVEQRQSLVAAQGRANVLNLVNRESQIQAELVTIEAAAHNGLLQTMKAETEVSARLLVEKGYLTKAAFESITGAEFEVEAVESLSVAFGNEIAALNTLTLSHSDLVAAMGPLFSGFSAITTEMRLQGEAATQLLTQMEALSPAMRATMVAEQGLVGVTGAANREMALQAELTSLMNIGQSDYIATLKTETLALAQLAVITGAITEARYNEIAGIKAKTVAVERSTASINLLSLSHSEFVALSVESTIGAQMMTVAMAEQGAETAALLAEMTALDPSIRAMIVSEQGAAGTMSAANKELALQAELTMLMNVEESEYIATLKAETLALAKLALIKGAITEERYNDIAGIKAETTALNQEAAALDRVGTASQRAAVAGTTLNGVTRGVAGATGTLWMSYGSVLPLLTAFAAVIGTIKGYKAAANFEYITKYIEALGKATGDTTASLADMQRGLLGIQDVAQGPVELAEGLKVLVKAGFSAKESLEELPTLARLATIAEEDLATTTSAVISQYRAWNVENVGVERGISSMAEAANVLAYAALSTTLDIKGLLGMMKFTTVLASQSAASFTEVTAALGVMSDMGIKQTTAATSLRTAMIQLQTPTSATIKLMNKLDLNPKIFKADGGLKNLPDMFYELSKSLRTLPDNKRIKVLNSLFSIRAITGGSTMLDHLERVKDLVAELETVKEETTFVNDMYGDLAKTTKVLWDETKASWEKAGLQALDTDAIKELIQLAKDYADSGALTATAEGVSGTVTAFAATTGAIVDMLQVAATPFQNIWNSVANLGTSLMDLRIIAFGATNQFLAMQRAGELYAKQIEGTVRLTITERNAIEFLTVAYGSLNTAARAAVFDKKLSAIDSAIAELEAKTKLAEKEVKLLHFLEGEKIKLLGQKRDAVEHPSVALARAEKELDHERAIIDLKKETAKASAEGLISDSVNSKLQNILLKERDSQATYELRVLKEQQRAKLIAAEDYRKQVYDIDLARLKDKATVLKLEQKVAGADFDKVLSRVGDDVYASPKEAQQDLDRARVARAKAASAVKQNEKNQERLTDEYAARGVTIKLKADSDYAKASLAVISQRSSKEKEIVGGLIETQLTLLDGQHSAGLIKEGEYLKERRALKFRAIKAEETDVKNQLSVLKAKRDSVADMPKTAETAVEVRRLQNAIEATEDSLDKIGENRDTLHQLINLEDINRMKTFSDMLKDVHKASELRTKASDFETDTMGMGGKRQALESARRGFQLERDEEIAKVIKAEGANEGSFKKVERIIEAYAEVDSATLATFSKMKKASKDTWGGMEKGLNDYAEEAEDVFGHTANLVSGAFSKMEDAMVDFAMTGKLSFTDMANSIISDMIRIMVQQSITGPLASGMGNILGRLLGDTPSTVSGADSAAAWTAFESTHALGDVFNNGRVQPFASGGIVDSPHVFPLANGTGLMGEAGPEAILPLTRINGRLGVETSGNSGGETNVIVNNYGDAQKVDVQKRKNSSGGVDIVVSLEKELSDRIKTRGSKLSQTLESTYGFRRVGGR